VVQITMQLIIPDCCLGEFCPGIHAEGHRQREDGTYYSTDDDEGKAYHYHNTDGSVFYRYPDGSEYYRRKNGSIRIRPPIDHPQRSEKADVVDVHVGGVENPAGTTPEAPAPPPTPPTTATDSPISATGSSDRVWRPWYDWPPQLNLSVETSCHGASVTIRDAAGSMITFRPVGNETGPVPKDSGLPSGHAHQNGGGSQPGHSATFAQEWVKKQALADILSRGQRKDLGGLAGNDPTYSICSKW